MKQMTLHEENEVIERYGLKPDCPLYAQIDQVPVPVVGFSLVRDEHGQILGINLITELFVLQDGERRALIAWNKAPRPAKKL